MRSEISETASPTTTHRMLHLANSAASHYFGAPPVTRAPFSTPRLWILAKARRVRQTSLAQNLTEHRNRCRLAKIPFSLSDGMSDLSKIGPPFFDRPCLFRLHHHDDIWHMPVARNKLGQAGPERAGAFWVRDFKRKLDNPRDQK